MKGGKTFVFLARSPSHFSHFSISYLETKRCRCASVAEYFNFRKAKWGRKIIKRKEGNSMFTLPQTIFLVSPPVKAEKTFDGEPSHRGLEWLPGVLWWDSLCSIPRHIRGVFLPNDTCARPGAFSLKRKLRRWTSISHLL